MPSTHASTSAAPEGGAGSGGGLPLTFSGMVKVPAEAAPVGEHPEEVIYEIAEFTQAQFRQLSANGIVRTMSRPSDPL